MARVFDFAVGQTDPSTFPREAFKAAAVRAIDAEYEAFNRYPGALGHPRLRQLMAERESVREGVTVPPELIAITNGSMQAVTLVGQSLMEARGDIVLTEEFTYSGTISAYRGIGLTMIGVAMDEHGMRVDSLREHLARLANEGTLPRFIYTLTTYQNPTGSMMPLERKREMVQVAREYGVPVVEDNCYGDVHFEGAKVPSMFTFDEGDDLIYIGSLSKILAPGVRLGYLHARNPMFNRIVAGRYDAGSNYFASAVVAEYYKDGIWQHCEETNPVLKHKRDLVIAQLGEHLEDICTWSEPVGGLFMWLRVPEDTDMDHLTRLANENGFYFAPGKAFHVEYRDVPYLRLAFGHVPDEDIVDGIPVLARSIREARRSNEPRRFESLYDPEGSLPPR